MFNKLKAIVFGIGDNYKKQYNYINYFFDVVALVDNSPIKQGTQFNGLTIESPESIYKYNYDCIIITLTDNQSLDIKNQLIKMGIPTSKMRFYGGGIEPFSINSNFFKENLCHSEKKQLFSENVERVIIELNSKCNRKCWFCTNSILADSCSIDMQENILDKILGELSEIDYDQEICLSFFNEPFLCTKLIEYIKKIKNVLPKTYVYLATNADYMTEEKVIQLSDAGLNLLIIDIYINKFEYDIEEAYLIANKIKEKCKLPIQLEKREFQMGYGRLRDMDIEVFSQDFSKRASNRAESLPEHLPIPRITSHPLPCIKNFISFHIDFRGDVWPCPNFHREFNAHRQYCVGNVLSDDIYNIYIGKKLVEYREKNLFHRNTLPCRSCIWDFNTFISNRYHLPFRDRPYKNKHRSTLSK